MSTDRFSITLNSASANNIVLLVDFNRILAKYEEFKADNLVEHSIIAEDFHAKVGLFSLLEADLPDSNALASPAAQDAAYSKVLKEGQKVFLQLYTARGNGPWQFQGEEALQNKNGFEHPWALMAPLLGTNETAVLGESLKVGLRIADKAQGIGGLKQGDYIEVFIAYRKVTKIESKKNSLDSLQAQISSLQMVLEGMLANIPANSLLGRGETAGVVSAISRAQFASATNPIFAGIVANNGGRIQFPVVQAPSEDPNTLDDYEEGTFVPSIIGMSTAGVGTYSIQTGSYIKIGKAVQFRVHLVWSTHSGSGGMRVSELPFLSAESPLMPVMTWHNNLNFIAGNTLQAYVIGVAGGIGQIVLQQIPTGGGVAAVIPVDTQGALIASGIYFATS